MTRIIIIDARKTGEHPCGSMALKQTGDCSDMCVYKCCMALAKNVNTLPVQYTCSMLLEVVCLKTDMTEFLCLAG